MCCADGTGGKLSVAYRIAKFQKFWRVQGFCQAVRAYRAGRRADKKKIWGPLTLKRAVHQSFGVPDGDIESNLHPPFPRWGSFTCTFSARHLRLLIFVHIPPVLRLPPDAASTTCPRPQPDELRLSVLHIDAPKHKDDETESTAMASKIFLQSRAKASITGPRPHRETSREPFHHPRRRSRLSENAGTT